MRFGQVLISQLMKFQKIVDSLMEVLMKTSGESLEKEEDKKEYRRRERERKEKTKKKKRIERYLGEKR